MGHHRRTTYSFYQPRCALASWYTAVAKHLEEGILPYVPQPTASDYHHSSAEQPSLPLSLLHNEAKKFPKRPKFYIWIIVPLMFIYIYVQIFQIINNYDISCQITGAKKFECNFKRFLKLMCAPLSLSWYFPPWLKLLKQKRSPLRCNKIARKWRRQEDLDRNHSLKTMK